nr:protein trichome birefringence-like 34 [Tanacetum cinerariifolium]
MEKIRHGLEKPLEDVIRNVKAALANTTTSAVTNASTQENKCPYLEDTFACQTYGRKDVKFNGKALIERLRGKRILFVGDSLNRNQWNSEVSMVDYTLSRPLKSIGSSLDDPNQEYEEVDSLRAYKMGLRTWSKWTQTHIDPSKTKLFFMGVTATRLRAMD